MSALARSARAGKAARFHQRMFHQRCANARTGTEKQRENAFGQSAFANTLSHRASDKFARARMGRVTLHDHGIPCRKRGSRVASSNRKCQWKVAGPKHNHRAERAQERSYIGFGQRLALRISAVNACPHPRTFFNDLSKKPKLAARPGRFSL